MSCRGDNGVTLFEMVYPNITFDMPAGLAGNLPRAFSLDDLRTNFEAYIIENNIDTAFIDRIEPTAATLIALDDVRFDFLSEISVRICDAGSATCTVRDEVFYIDNLFNDRPRSELRLLPSLINAKRQLTQRRFKLEVWFRFVGVSPSVIPIRLDMQFNAVENR